MRQVPADFAPLGVYLIIGDGRLARHLRAFFTLEAIPFKSWSRRESEPELDSVLNDVSHVLLAVSDSAIEPFLNSHPALMSKICVHFSGAVVTPLAASAHPLMTFSNEIYELDTYRSIPFVLESGRGSMNSLLPGLLNESFEIEASQKALYHALCVMSGNFTVLLWEKVFKEFSVQLGLPKEILLPYLAQVSSNLTGATEGQSVLTGPLARRDMQTIERHLGVLGNDSYADVYRAFVQAHLKTEDAAPTPFPLGGL